MSSNLTCDHCRKTTDELIETDEYRKTKELKQYCETCFLDLLKNGFGHYDPDHCDCGGKMILAHDDEEIISMLRDDGTIHYVCERNINQEDDNHDWFALYVVEPDDPEDGEMW